MLGLTIAGWLVVGRLPSGLVPFKSGKTAFVNFQTAQCDDRESFKGKAEFKNDVKCVLLTIMHVFSHMHYG